MRKKYFIAITICFIYAAAAALHLLASTMTWSYPDYLITAADSEHIMQSVCRVAAVILSMILIAAAYRLARRKERKAGVLALAGIAIYIVWLLAQGNVLYDLQMFFIGGFDVWCWFAAAISKKYFGMQIGRVLYAVFGICAFLISNYSCAYHEITSGRPLTLLFMTTVFMMANVMFFLKDSKQCVRRKGIYTAVGSLALTILFSFPRLTEIAASAGVSSVSANNHANWFLYRIEALKAVFAGNYPDAELDELTREQVQDFDILWLGQAFPRWMQAAYIILAAAIICCLILIIRNSGKYSGFCVFLAGSILAANIVGIISEINLFYGADVGVLVSQNIYQLIPAIFLAAEMPDRNIYLS